MEIERTGTVIRHTGDGQLRRSAGMQTRQQIGVIVPAALDFGREVLRGVRAWCEAHAGARMVLISEGGFSGNLVFPQERLDCLVVMHYEQTELESLRLHCPHIVVVSNRNPLSGFAQVINDEAAIGRMGAAYLMGRGYRTLAFLTPKNLLFAREREAGFVETVTRAGLPVHLFEGGSNPETVEAVREILTLPGPIALMTASDLHARWAIESLEDPGAVVPERLAILGVDNDSLQNALAPIGISSIQLAGERVGYEASALGMRLSRGAPMPANPVRIAPRDVVSRRSTDNLAVTDRTAARVIRLVRERMAELRDAGDLVDALGIPRRTLEVRFHKATGSTLAHELANARIQRARELLSTTDLSIKEISFLVGFSEPRMLTLVFKRLTGEKPSDYRARVRPGE